MRGLNTQHDLQIAAVSNEGRELTTYRVQQFSYRPTRTVLAEFRLKIGK